MTLIEVLVALLVFTIGLLALAGLQLTNMRFNHSTYLSTQATLQANDMADRLRANPQGVAAHLYDNMSGLGASPPPACSGAGANCTPTEISRHDRFEWNSANATLLPSGRGTVTGNGKGSVFTITVMWDDERNGATGTGCDPDDPTDLKCHSVSLQP